MPIMATKKQAPKAKATPKSKAKPSKRAEKAVPPVVQESLIDDNKPLTYLERQFVAEYVRMNGNAQQAYHKVNPDCTLGSAGVSGHRMLKRAKIKEAIAELHRKADERACISRAWVLDKLVDNLDRCMTAIPVTDRQGNPTGEWTYKATSAIRILELIGKDIGMYGQEDNKAGPKTQIVVMNDDQKRSALQAIFGSLGVASGPADSGRPADGAGLALDRPDADHDQGGDDPGFDADGSPFFQGESPHP